MTSPLAIGRSALRRTGLGPVVLRARRAIRFGFKAEVATLIAQKRYLRSILKAPPLAAGVGEIDCFMLLNQARLWEGLWALYSFRSHFGPCRIVVLDDGTLKDGSHTILKTLFPGIQVPAVVGHDAAMLSQLQTLGLNRCHAWRHRFVFFRKLVDPCLLAENKGMVLLDSDCLHFRVPEEVVKWAENPDRVRFIADLARHSFCAPHATLSRICGAVLPEFFCAGYLCLPTQSLQLHRVEQYLADPCFMEQLSSGKFSHVAEQSLQAMEAAVVGAEVLPKTYATCPDVPQSNAVAGHFCGGSVERTWFYTKGIPLVARQFGLWR
ncbi:MAG: hypothetical protein NTY01_07655 [Verrucomicrobia bacterium]|nr:hypothetical protein [Verrucomicrobiota bacterium]